MQNQSNVISNLHEAIIDLYLQVKVRSNDEVSLTLILFHLSSHLYQIDRFGND
jgi:hypothetical protein